MNYKEIFLCLGLTVYLSILNDQIMRLSLYDFLLLVIWLTLAWVIQRFIVVLSVMKFHIMMLDVLSVIQKRLAIYQKLIEHRSKAKA